MQQIAPVQLGPVRVDPPLWLAPMAGVTDRDFRLIVRRIGGVGVVSMEFISSKAIVSGNERTRELMYFSHEERPLAIQIYGSDAATMARRRGWSRSWGPTSATSTWAARPTRCSRAAPAPR